MMPSALPGRTTLEDASARNRQRFFLSIWAFGRALLGFLATRRDHLQSAQSTRHAREAHHPPGRDLSSQACALSPPFDVHSVVDSGTFLQRSQTEPYQVILFKRDGHFSPPFVVFTDSRSKGICAPSHPLGTDRHPSPIPRSHRTTLKRSAPRPKTCSIFKASARPGHPCCRPAMFSSKELPPLTNLPLSGPPRYPARRPERTRPPLSTPSGNKAPGPRRRTSVERSLTLPPHHSPPLLHSPTP